MTDLVINQQVIFCAICGFATLNIRKLVNHIGEYDGFLLVCGIENCSLEFTSINTFKSHLATFHSYFFPYIINNCPSFSDISVFTTSSFEFRTKL